MTAGKFGRLLIVLLIPLLIAGYATSLYFDPYDGYETYFCSPHCRSLGPMDGKLYDSVARDFQHRFSVYVDNKESYLKHNIEAVLPTIRGAKILGPISDTPNSGTSVLVDGYDIVGMSANIIFGMAGNNSVFGGTAHLYCGMLVLDTKQSGMTTGPFTASCHSDNPFFVQQLSFSVGGESQELLTDMVSSIWETIEQRELDYYIYKVVSYPIFLYMFLILSALAWMTVQAFKFVRNG